MGSMMGRATMARALAALFLAASVLAGMAGPADAARMSKCRNNAENFEVYRGKCMSDKRIERIKERRHHRGEDHGHHGPNHQ
jgi:hypothetical protein